MATYKVNVSNIASITTKEHLHEFFTFCGRISSIDYDENNHQATISFEKASAAKTALMLNGGGLDGSALTVASDEAHVEDDHHNVGEHPLEQSDKPRAGIAAEYIAKGYKLSDSILQRAIDMDKKHGISQKFLRYFQSVDKTIGERALGPEQTVSAKVQATVEQATQQARAVDQQKGYSKIANDYYSKAISSQWGQKVLDFYTKTSKQVIDIHEEARRIAHQEKLKDSPTVGDVEADKPTKAWITYGFLIESLVMYFKTIWVEVCKCTKLNLPPDNWW